jgi:DNA-directed RNA polymerase II subunit RPB1
MASADRKYDVIKSVNFGVFAPDELLRVAAAKVTSPSTHTSSLPTPGGANDIRLGSTDRRLKCATCARPCSQCVGHQGAIQLAFPVYNVGFFDLVLKCLKVACFYCSALVLSPAHVAQLRMMPDHERKKRLGVAAALAKAKRLCAACGGPNPHYTKAGLAIKADFSKVTFTDPDEAAYCTRPFTSGEARTILQNITDADCTLLGLSPATSRPENFITSVMCVVPPTIRPSVLISEGSKSRGHDDLTTKLCDIVKCNDTLRSILEREAASIPDSGLSIAAQTAVHDLTMHCGTFISNDIRGQKPSYQRTGIPSKSIMSRLKGKDGRIRGTLMGKRCNFSARSVISPNPDMDIDEVGIPYRVARSQTVPERVTDLNSCELRNRVRNGTSFETGAHSIRRASGGVVLLEFADAEREAGALKLGDIVERYLRDGDYVLFNRQPSLHKGSFMAFRVKLMADNTFRINLACTPSLNADCDGDEMNVHVLQDAESQTEARLLMAAPLQIVSPQSNKPCMGLVQDALLGAYLLSADTTLLTRLQICDIAAGLRYPQQGIPHPSLPDGNSGGGMWYGRQALELTFPPDLYYTSHRAEPPVVIENGKFLRGRLCKATLGATYGSLVHLLWLEYSPTVCARFMSDVQRLVNRFLLWRGFSVRFSDCLTTKDVQSRISTIIASAEDKVTRIEENKQLLEALQPEAEMVSKGIADQVLTNVGKVVHASLDKANNALYQTVSCGSKGNLINVAQIMGSVGQQSLEGMRIPSVVHGLRRIPLSIDSSVLRPHGFIRASYVKGLRPDEFFYHNMTGREGLIDTSVKTATTGYMQRRLMKALETLKVEEDRTVRNSRNDIVQFVYGADDFDSCYLMRIDMSFARRSWRDIAQHLTPSEAAPFRPLLERALDHRGTGTGEFDTQAFAPVRLAGALVRALEISGEPASQLYVEEAVSPFCSESGAAPVGSRGLLELYLRWELRCSKLLPLSISTDGVDHLLARLRAQLRRAKVDAAEMVGALASHSLSCPLTQLVLNTFHYAGVSEKNVTLGVPRIKELIDVAKCIKTPTMIIVPHPSLSVGTPLKVLKTSLVRYPIGWAVERTEVAYESEFFHTSSGGPDEKLVAQIDQLLSPPSPPLAFNPFVAYIELKRPPLVERNMEPADVAEIIRSHLTPNCHVVYAEAPMCVWFVKLRLLGMSVGGTTFADKPADEMVFLKTATLETCDKVCRACYLSGIPGVTSVNENLTILRHIGPGGELVQRKITVLATDGSNLIDALALEEICGAKTTSNDVSDVLRTLGLEAAVRVLFDELQRTIGFDGNFINPRHISLLVALMSHRGYMVAVNRHGINRLWDNGPIAKCTFEETCDVLLEAAAYGEVDEILGVSECVAVGKRARVGTGACDVVSILPPSQLTSAQEEEEDDVVFTSVDADMEQQNSRPEYRPIEMPFAEDACMPSIGSMSMLPSSLHRSFMQPAPAATSGIGTYAPSSPRRALEESRKRRYVPSSPRIRNQRPFLGTFASPPSSAAG